MAVDRVSQRRGLADQILAFDTSARHYVRASGRPDEVACANRARLSRAQAGGRARSFRRTRMAGLPSPRHPVHRSLWILGLRAGDDSPPVDLVPPGYSKNTPFPPVIDPEVPPIRPERHIPNSIATVRRRLIVALTRRLSRCPCCTRPIKQTRRRLFVTQ